MKKGMLRKWVVVAAVFVFITILPLHVCAEEQECAGGQGYAGGQEYAPWDAEVQKITKSNRPGHDPNLDMEAMENEFAKFLYPFGSLIDEPVPHPEALGFGLPKAIISKQEALEDVEHLFSLLKYGYAGYQYFGGDERFQLAKQRMLEELQTEFPDQFPSAAFDKLIHDCLHFINDGHLMIGNHRYLRPQTMYMSFDYEFFKDDSGYYTTTNGLQEYVELVNGESVDPYLWSSLNVTGEIVYRIGRLADERSKAANHERLEISLRSNEARRQESLLLEREVRTRQVPDGSYRRYELEGIPVIDLQQFRFVGPGLGQFLDDALELKDEDVFIIDLRSSPGGLAGNIGNWLHSFTGNWVDGPAQMWVQLRTNTTRELARYSKEGEPRWMIDALFPVRETGWTRIRPSSGNAPIANPTKIVVLMDSWSASAGEIFVRRLRQIENVVFIGTNTSGTLIIGDPIKGKLPNSYIGTHWGTALKLEVESGKFVDREGVGYLPDFWVQSEDALDLALKFIHKYGMSADN